MKHKKKTKQWTCVKFSRVDNAFLVSLVGLRPEKYFWLGLSNRKNIDEFVWTKGNSVRFTHWNTGMPGMEKDSSIFKIKLVKKSTTIYHFPLQLQVPSRAAWRWQLGFWLDSGICCPARIRRNTSANTWRRGQFWLCHHLLSLLPSVQRAGLKWGQDTTALRYKNWLG